MVRDALTRVTAAILDVQDHLARTTGDLHPTAWATALDDLHAALVELAKLATIVQGHHRRWERAEPTPYRGSSTRLASTLLGEASVALASAAATVKAAGSTSTRPTRREAGETDCSA